MVALHASETSSKITSSRRNATPDLLTQSLVVLEPLSQTTLVRRLPLPITNDRRVAQDQVGYHRSKYQTAVVIQVRLIALIQIILLGRLVPDSIDVLQRCLVQIDVPCGRAVSSRNCGETLVGKIIGCFVLGSEVTSSEWGDEDLARTQSGLAQGKVLYDS